MKIIFFLFLFVLLYIQPLFGMAKSNNTAISANFSFYNACPFEPVLFTDLSTGEITTWQWDFASGTGTSEEQDPEFIFSGAGSFQVQLIVSNDCESDTIVRQVIIKNFLSSFRDTTVCNDEPFEFSGQTYSRFVQFSDNFIFQDTLLSTFGCDSFVTLNVNVNPCDCFLTFPNAFTPNADGLNDTFLPYTVCDQEIRNYSLIIYNRWGETVFETFGFREAWDGNINGYPMTTDALVYIVEYEIVDGDSRKEFREVGDFTLIR